MVETALDNDHETWKVFFRKHWKMLVLFAAAAISASIGAILVYLWLVGDAQSTGMVPTSLGLWTMGHLVTFVLHLIFWKFSSSESR